MSRILFNSYSPEYCWLSNFETAPVTDLKGRVWSSAEHCYQAAKTKEVAFQDRIAMAATAKLAKQMGRDIPMRSDWAKIKVEVMRRILVAKFTQNPELYSLLLSTETDKLVHEAPWDGFWGTGKNGRGRNVHGNLLMALRDQWRKTPPTTVENIRFNAQAMYIGRAGHGHDGYFGNPFATRSRCELCDDTHSTPGSTLPCFAIYFHDHLKDDPDYKEAVLQLAGDVLGCFCKTRSGIGNPCHGDIISLWLNNYGDKQ